jgi:hypothetical protein
VIGRERTVVDLSQHDRRGCKDEAVAGWRVISPSATAPSIYRARMVAANSRVSCLPDDPA